LAAKKTAIVGTNIETGIEGLDQILNGGLPARNQTLIVGGPGTGKTLIVTELLYNCAKRGIPCCLIAFDEQPENIVRNFKNAFPNLTDIDDLIKKRVLIIDGNDTAVKIATNKVAETGYSMGDLISDIEGIIKSNESQIIVLDSLSFLKLMLGKTLLYNKSVSAIISNMRRLGVTTILTLDIPYYNSAKMKFVQEMLFFDGILGLFEDDQADDKGFGIQIIKMRGFSYSRGIKHYTVTSEGIKFK
jgi:circadian clock protein KaiC